MKDYDKVELVLKELYWWIFTTFQRDICHIGMGLITHSLTKIACSFNWEHNDCLRLLRSCVIPAWSIAKQHLAHTLTIAMKKTRWQSDRSQEVTYINTINPTFSWVYPHFLVPLKHSHPCDIFLPFSDPPDCYYHLCDLPSFSLSLPIHPPHITLSSQNKDYLSHANLHLHVAMLLW